MREQPLNRSIRGLIIAALFLITGVLSAQPLPSCYFTRAGADSLVHMLADSFPTLVRVDSIGHSNGTMLDEQYPIYAVTVTRGVNVQPSPDRPSSLVIAHIHGEEVIGLQVAMRYLMDICHRQGLYRDLLNNTILYIIPTINPDGLEVISRGNIDMTWRKNGYKPSLIGDRDCNVFAGTGGDTCGIDLNRNFDFNWIYGDTLLTPPYSGYVEPFDYYRGPSPASEPETQAVMAFSTRIKPTLSIVYHGSRQGGNSYKSIIAWEYGPANQFHKFSPDCTAIDYINMQYVLEYPHPNVDITYNSAWGLRRNGNLQDWFYRTLGTYQYNTELGPRRDIQPMDCHILDSLVAVDMPALNWMNLRLINAGGTCLTPITIHTYDAGTNPPTPISCEWRNLNTWNPLLGPWYTNEQYGRATFLPMQGRINIMTRKEGYVTQTTPYTVQPHSSPDNVDIMMQPLPWYYLTLRLHGSGDPLISGRVYLDGEFPHWLDLPTGQDSIRLPQGSFRVMAEATAPGRMAMWKEIYLGGANTVDFWLPPSTVVMSENFDGGLGNWTVGGTGNPWNIEQDTSSMHTGSALVTHPLEGYQAQYDNDLNSWLRYNPQINLADSNVAYLSFMRRGRTEFPADSFFIEVSINGGTDWATAAGFSDLEVPWTRASVNLSPWTGHRINLRFRFKSDSALGDLGLTIDNVVLYKGIDLEAPPQPSAAVYTYRITGSYPNPFNPTTTINYEVAKPGPITMVLYNSLGQEVRRFDINSSSAGPQHLLWDGTSANGRSVASGLYFVQLQAPHSLATHKLLLLR